MHDSLKAHTNCSGLKGPNLESLKKEVVSCQLCPLRQGCQQVIFGSGNPNSSLLLIGEGPGAQEDLEGIPFVGRAGQLLDKILAAIKLKRSDVYITNIVKCRPPGNRKPNEEEISTCIPWLKKELDIIKPDFIVLLGATALQAIIDPKGKITKMRGLSIHRDGYHFIPTFHPAALLRDPRKKIEVWEDFQKIERFLQNAPKNGG